jgi:hypothetical protein
MYAKLRRDYIFSADWLRKRTSFYEKRLAQGFNVILLKYGSKMPWGSWRDYQSKHAPAEMIRRALSVPKINFGIVTGITSGFVVVDIEDEQSKAILEGHLPSAPLRVKTAKKEHWYYSTVLGQIVPRKIRVQLKGQRLNVEPVG